MAASGEPNHALIFGVSGVSGWAIAREALSYPDRSKFSLVTALSNRPLSTLDSALPADPRLQLASGVDLTQPVEDVMQMLRNKVKHVNTVTHIFFTAYVETADYPSLVQVNTALIRTAVSAVDQVAPKLKAVILQTGGKHYGVEYPNEVELKVPLKEGQGRLPAPYKNDIFYYSQVDVLKELSAKRSWSFTEVRPDLIVGFTPGANFMNGAQGLAYYLVLCKAVHGSGAKVPFPGTERSYRAKHSPTFQDILARLEIYAALNQDKCGGGRAFNAADGEVARWLDVWPSICSYFGLVGEGPGSQPLGVEGFKDFFQKNKPAWDKLVEEHDLKTGILEKYSWSFLWAVTTKMDVDRQYDLSACRSVGFDESVSTVKGYTISFDRMREAKIIP